MELANELKSDQHQLGQGPLYTFSETKVSPHRKGKNGLQTAQV